jgi:cytoskeletal protein CcmA (bactofilin family)
MSEQVTNFQFSSQPGMAGDPVESVIGPTLVIKGEVTAEEDLLIMGRVEGKIDHNQTLTVHSEGSVKAVMKAKNIQVDGSVEGDIYGTEGVKICETGKVVGNVYAPRVGLNEGATFKGMVDMDSDAAAVEARFSEQTARNKPVPITKAAQPVPAAVEPEPKQTAQADANADTDAVEAQAAGDDKHGNANDNTNNASRKHSRKGNSKKGASHSVSEVGSEVSSSDDANDSASSDE